MNDGDEGKDVENDHRVITCSERRSDSAGVLSSKRINAGGWNAQQPGGTFARTEKKYVMFPKIIFSQAIMQEF